MQTEIEAYRRLKRALIEEYGDLDEDTLADTLEGLTTLQDTISAVIRSALDDEALARAAKERLDDLKSRHARLRERAVAKRRASAGAMAEAGLTRILEPDFTVSLRPPCHAPVRSR